MALIGLISDVHASPEPVEEAINIFMGKGVDQILCAGDIAGYMDQLDQTVSLLKRSNCQTVVGNHDQSYLKRHGEEADAASIQFLKELPATYEMEMSGKRLYMVHAQPPDESHGGIKLLNKDGEVEPGKREYWSQKLETFDYDVLVVGHTHQVFAEYMGGVLVVNPGSSVFNHSCAILNLQNMLVEMIPLSGEKIEKTWNWGEHMIYAK
ncbi:MAG: hypothetical protein DIZ80_05700 [endosymbiont of Galathealinum brachiosum]|uniref:Phosphoesterase n=1 Tax=endosymbiont of Galathealinum brachiosum TaxID=2200906 RepID=A0A370DKW4_9GAMM|nr:MAG: hypothetical protein DIZ80_05700 [endosymbiont of Galathealinum brachiosum]